jgi:hypothetical protein
MLPRDSKLETVDDIGLAMESVPEGVRSWILISLEGGRSSLNLDIPEACNYNSVAVPYL